MNNRTDMTWPRPLTLAGVAVPGLLALLAAGGCSPSGDGAAVGQDAIDRAARAIVRAEDRIAAPDLADLLISDRSAVTVLDLRPQAEFEAGHVDGARHADLATLLSPDGRAGLGEAVRLVLISADGSQAAQAAALLRVTGIHAEALDGGYAAWRRLMEGGDSDIPVDVAAARAEAKRRAVACWFEGDYVAAAGLAVKKPDAGTVTGGYVPPLTPAVPGTVPPAEDSLGLGLGLEPGTPGAAPVDDPLGLGLGAPEGAGAKPARKLKIREGC